MRLDEVPDSNRNKRYEQASRAAERHFGGPTWKGRVRLTDPEDGNKVVYDNGDVIAMAKRNIQRGGQAATELDNLRSASRKPLEDLVDKYWYTKTKCQQCKSDYDGWNVSVYKDGFRCWLCYYDNTPIEIPPEEKERIEKTYPYIEKYCSFHTNDTINQKRVMNIYLRRVLKLKELND